VHKFSPCSYFVYSDTADNFFAPTVYGDLLCYLHRLWRAWLMMVPVFARSVLATPMRAFVPDTLPSLANSALRIELLRLQLRLPQVLLLQTANTTENFLWLNNDIDHDNINFIDFIYGDYITNGIIDHDYSTLTPGYIDISNKSYHLTSGLCSSQTVRFTADPTAGCVRVYHVLVRLGSLNIII
jgi:hypothetical protein